ncbi:hypothetical protein DFH28DRAFT_1079441 [Melampsora americana]|nr:hypothetical protein DFH28DRAFT_1079441 [Melampsora americana]
MCGVDETAWFTGHKSFVLYTSTSSHWSNMSGQKDLLHSWGELYIFDLPKPLRGALFAQNLITFPYGPSLAPEPRIEASEEIWTDNPEWIKKIKLSDKTYRFKFFRCAFASLRRLQHDDEIFGHRRWTLIIFGKETIAAIHLQTDLSKCVEIETIKDRLTILKDEVKIPALVVQRKNAYSKSKKKKAVEKLSRKSQRGIDKDPMNKDPMNKAGSELLASWENELEKSEMIFVGAKSSALYNKLRAFPFPFGSPSIEELKRCYVKLTTAKLDAEVQMWS